MVEGSARRGEVAEAVWRVLAERGFAGLTVRAVAEALGRTTGLVMHHFPTKDALTAFALEVLEERTERARPPRSGATGREAVRGALVAMLPLDEASTTTNRAWIASWDAALASGDLRIGHAARYRRGRERLAALLAAADVADPDEAADRLQGAMLGLIVQSVLDPETHAPADRVARVDRLLDELLPPAPAADQDVNAVGGR